GVAVAVFFFMMMLSTIVGVMQGTTVLSEATTEIRYVAYYLAYFVIFFLIRKDSKISFLMYTFVFIGTFVAAAMPMNPTNAKSIMFKLPIPMGIRGRMFTSKIVE
ncbi:MAG: hypothetical protein AAFV93_08975, partial [Chloroflexota bacterium]